MSDNYGRTLSVPFIGKIYRVLMQWLQFVNNINN